MLALHVAPLWHAVTSTHHRHELQGRTPSSYRDPLVYDLRGRQRSGHLVQHPCPYGGPLAISPCRKRLKARCDLVVSPAGLYVWAGCLCYCLYELVNLKWTSFRPDKVTAVIDKLQVKPQHTTTGMCDPLTQLIRRCEHLT